MAIRARRVAEDHMAAARPARADRLLHVGATDRVDDGGNPNTFGSLRYRLGEPVKRQGLDAEPGLDPLRSAGCGEHLGTQCDRQLDGGRSDGAGRTQHQDGLTRLNAGMVDQGVAGSGC